MSIPRRRVTASLLIAGAATFSLAACTPNPGPVATLPVATMPASPSATPATGDAPSTAIRANISGLAGAMLTNDTKKADGQVAPGSPADRYLAHHAGLNKAMLGFDPKHTEPPRQQKTTWVGPDMTVTFTTEGSTDVTWQDFTYDPAGLIYSWSVGAKKPVPLPELLWTETAAGSNDYASIEMASAFVNEHGLWVVLNVTATKLTIETDTDASFYGGDDPETALAMFGPDTITKGHTAQVAYLFTGAGLGGTVRYAVHDEDQNGFDTIEIQVR